MIVQGSCFQLFVIYDNYSVRNSIQGEAELIVCVELSNNLTSISVESVHFFGVRKCSVDGNHACSGSFVLQQHALGRWAGTVVLGLAL